MLGLQEMLATGWKKCFSNSKNRDYYVHESGKKQWHFPTKSIEDDKNCIRTCYTEIYHKHENEKIIPERKSFMNAIKKSLIAEFTGDLISDYENYFQFRVLDLGCGQGDDIEVFKELGSTSYLGIDQIKTNVRPGSCKQMDFCDEEQWMLIPQNSFDLITCFFSAQYAFCNTNSTQSFLRGISKAISEKGRSIVIVPDSVWKNTSKRWNKFTLNAVKNQNENEFANNNNNNKYFARFQELDIPGWFISDKLLLEVCEKENLVIEFSSNLASYCSWLGIQSPCLTDFRTSQFRECHQFFFEKKYSSNDWEESSFYRVLVFKHKKASTSFIKVREDLESWKQKVSFSINEKEL